MDAPLKGIKVVDFTRVLAGPHCTKTLRDLGADVIKIEPPSGDVGRAGMPIINLMSVYYVQQNAGKRNISMDLNYPEAREIAVDLCKDADVIVENFRPGTLARFGLGYEQVRQFNPRVVYVSMSGYGQTGVWRNRPAFAPTVQAEAGWTDTVAMHYQDHLPAVMNDSASHADVYTGLQGVIAVLAALQHRNTTGVGQHIDVAMAATILSVNERAGAQLSNFDTDGEPVALSAPESHIYAMPDGTLITIAASPLYTPMFMNYCAMMRRSDLLKDPRYATAKLRKENLASLLAIVRSWILSFTDIEELQAQVSEVSLAIGVVRTTNQLADTQWAKEWGAVVEVDDRAGGTMRMPGAPWHFSESVLPEPGIPSFQGEDNHAILAERNVDPALVASLETRRVLLSRKAFRGAYD